MVFICSYVILSMMQTSLICQVTEWVVLQFWASVFLNIYLHPGQNRLNPLCILQVSRIATCLVLCCVHFPKMDWVFGSIDFQWQGAGCGGRLCPAGGSDAAEPQRSRAELRPEEESLPPPILTCSCFHLLTSSDTATPLWFVFRF